MLLGLAFSCYFQDLVFPPFIGIQDLLLGIAFRLLLRAHLSSGDRVVVVIVLSVMSVNSSPLDPSGSGIGVVLA